MKPDSPQWQDAKAKGDAAELALADWWQRHGFTAHKSIGLADHDLRISADVEVKRDLKAKKTGNLAVEVAYNGQPSGIVTSRAAFWCIVINGDALLVRTDTLRRLALSPRWREAAAGDGNKARVKLVRMDQVRELPGVRIITLHPAGEHDERPAA